MIRFAIIVSASLAAFILFYLGIRNLGINKKHGLFMTTLLIALSLMACKVNQTTDRKIGSPATNQENDVPRRHAENGGALKQPEKQSERIVKLNGSKEWKDFKSYWKKLDRIAPPEKSGKEKESSSIAFGEYSGAITQDTAAALRKELDELTGGLKALAGEKEISPLEIELLSEICTARINYMSYGLGSMLSRMMPPPTTQNKDKSIKDLERNIDAIIELNKKGGIGAEELGQALSNVLLNIRDFSILHTIGSRYVLHYYAFPGNKTKQGEEKPGIAEKSIDEFEKHYADYIEKKKVKQSAGPAQHKEYYEDLDARYKETKKAIKEVKETLPLLEELVSDLEK